MPSIKAPGAAGGFLRYVSVGDSRVREEHQAWHGLVLPKDDAFWDANYPPNGFNCRCKVQAISEKEAGQMGEKAGRVCRRQALAASLITTRFVLMAAIKHSRAEGEKDARG